MLKPIVIIFVLFFAPPCFSQDYSEYQRIRQDGIDLYMQSDYFSALRKFQLLDNQTIIKPNNNDIYLWKDSCIIALENLVFEVQKNKQKADSALSIANNTLDKVGVLLFDLAVRSNIPDWPGYESMLSYDKTLTYEGREILKKIDSLDMSNYSLLKVPLPVWKCKNLKHINLIGNENIDLNNFFKKAKTSNLKSVYVSINDLNKIDSSNILLITGIDFTQDNLYKIPQNILKQKQLTFLSLEPQNKKNNLYSLPPELYSLTNLRYLNLSSCQIDSLSKDIKKLKKLKELNLSKNRLEYLPEEILSLSELEILNLSGNRFSVETQIKINMLFSNKKCKVIWE